MLSVDLVIRRFAFGCSIPALHRIALSQLYFVMLTSDSAGNLWIALGEGGCVAQFDPRTDKELMVRILHLWRLHCAVPVGVGRIFQSDCSALELIYGVFAACQTSCETSNGMHIRWSRPGGSVRDNQVLFLASYSSVVVIVNM